MSTPEDPQKPPRREQPPWLKGKGGRPKGVPNKKTRVLKEAVIQAAAIVGSDGKGKDELVGYLERIARRDMKSMAALLGRVLPYQLTGPNDGPVQVIDPSKMSGLSAEQLRNILATAEVMQGMVADPSREDEDEA